MLAFDQAREQLLSMATAPERMEHVPLLQAIGRVLAAPVISPMDVPAFANSAMDGYAVCPIDASQSPWRLTVTQRIAAGSTGNSL